MSALVNRKRVLQVEYDFAKDGGAIGTVTMRGGGLPSGAVITSGVIDVQTSLVGGAASTVALHLEAADDVLAADGINFLINLAAGLADIVPVGAAVAMVKTTATRNLTATIAGGALTAGKLVVCLEYYITTS